MPPSNKMQRNVQGQNLSDMDFHPEQLSLECVGKKFPLDQANAAIEESQKEARGGKVFLEG